MKCHLDDGSRRLGRLEVHMDPLHSDYHLGLLAEAFRGLVVVQIEHKWDRNVGIYTAFGEVFDPVPPHQQAPIYTVELGGLDGPKFTRRDS